MTVIASPYDRLTPFERAALVYDWRGTWARPEQVVPGGNWRTWLIQTGRGWGKTRVGAETVREWIEQGVRYVAFVGRTAADVRDVMVEGPAGILKISPPWNRPNYEPSKRRLTWPNGAVATLFSADEPDLLRGPQHEKAWADEAAAWEHADATWSNLFISTRLGDRPQIVVTTTPRPTAFIRSLVLDRRTVVTRGTTSDNADNLAPGYVEDLELRYGGSALYRQEVLGEILDDLARPYPRSMVLKCDAKLSKAAPIVWGWDFARAADETVGIALDRDGYGCRGERWSGVPWGETIAQVGAAIGTTVSYGDATGVGDPVVEAVQRAGHPMLPFKFTSASRQPLLERLASALSQQQIHGPFSTEWAWLTEELDAMEFQYTASGPRYTAPENIHDDGVMALALAVYGLDRIPKVWEQTLPVATPSDRFEPMKDGQLPERKTVPDMLRKLSQHHQRFGQKVPRRNGSDIQGPRIASVEGL